MNPTIYIEELRINDQNDLWQPEYVFLSFGRAENAPDTAWVDSLSTDRQTVKPFKRGEVQCWAFPQSRYNKITEEALKVADVVINTISTETDVCNGKCRGAEHTKCECVCGGEFHGQGVGLNPREVIKGDLILTHNYRKIEKHYDRRPPAPKKIGWDLAKHDTGLVWDSEEDPKSFTEILERNGIHN